MIMKVYKSLKIIFIFLCTILFFESALSQNKKVDKNIIKEIMKNYEFFKNYEFYKNYNIIINYTNFTNKNSSKNNLKKAEKNEK